MESSTLMYNAYNPYGDFKSDINSIIEQEKKVNEELINTYNENKRKVIPRDADGKIDHSFIYEQITYVLNQTFVDLFEKKDLKNLLSQDRWVGLGYIFIIVYLAYFISKL